MQKFIEADYYELDWYYEECTDGKYAFVIYWNIICLLKDQHAGLTQF